VSSYSRRDLLNLGGIGAALSQTALASKTSKAGAPERQYRCAPHCGGARGSPRSQLSNWVPITEGTGDAIILDTSKTDQEILG
jgi:hypothetical protein